MKTSIVILTFNHLEYTKNCIDSICKYTNKNEYEIIIVDNNSTDGTVSWLKEQKDIKAIYNKENVGFPRGCNQGISVSTGDNILLLNNDVIVTSRWLDNLVHCLYSKSDIGAVGPVTNNAWYYQSIDVNYQSETEMQLFAETINRSNSNLWEERLKLVGFCMLIKRSVLDQIGALDERFSPGNYEDDDLSYRIRLAGFRLILCKDTFIHHFGSVSFNQDNSRLLKENRNKFLEKWGFHSDSTLVRFEVAALMDSPEDAPLNILDVGCACGGTLLYLKNKYKKAALYGIEINKNAAQSAARFAEVSAQDIEKLQLTYPPQFFDYILLANVLEHLRELEKVLTAIKQYLKPNGKLLVSLPNVIHFSEMKKMLQGFWNHDDPKNLGQTPLHFFTLYEIDKTFKELGYCVQEYRMTTFPETEQDSDFIKKVTQLMGDPNLAQQYRANQYIFAAKLKAPFNLVFLLRRIEYDIDKAQTLNTLMEFIESGVLSTNDIIHVTENDMVKKEEILQIVAVSCYERKLIESALILLENAYQRNKRNPITTCKLAYILSKTGKTAVALGLLDQLNQKDAKILELIAKIKEAQHEPA